MQIPAEQVHALKDNLTLAAAWAASIAAIIMPWLLNRDTKRTMAVSAGKLIEKVDGHEKRLDKVEETVGRHTSEIGTLQGRAANGAAFH